MGLAISILFVIIILQLLEFYLDYRSLCEISPSKVSNNGKITQRAWLYYVRRAGKHYIYVFGNLMSQGFNFNYVNCKKRNTLKIFHYRWALQNESFILSSSIWCHGLTDATISSLPFTTIPLISKPSSNLTNGRYVEIALLFI